MIRATAPFTLLAVTTLTALLPSTAAAEWHLTPLIGFTFKGGTNIVFAEDAATSRHWYFGGAVTLIGAGPIGVESIFMYAPGFFETDETIDIVGSRTIAWTGNIVLATPRRWNEYGLRPFVSGGVGVLSPRVDYVPEQVFPLPVRETIPAFNIGGGAVGFLTDRAGVRFDLRYFDTIRRSDELSDEPVAFGRVRLHYWTASIGLVLRP